MSQNKIFITINLFSAMRIKNVQSQKRGTKARSMSKVYLVQRRNNRKNQKSNKRKALKEQAIFNLHNMYSITPLLLKV